MGTSRRSVNYFPWIMPGGGGSGERMLAPDSSFHWSGSPYPQFLSILPHSCPFPPPHPLCVHVHIPLVRTPLMYAFVLRYISCSLIWGEALFIISYLIKEVILLVHSIPNTVTELGSSRMRGEIVGQRARKGALESLSYHLIM